MRMYDLIEKKKTGRALSEEEIRWMTNAYTNEEIPDYQMSAMMMAVWFQGLNADETLALTLAMRDSGDCMDLSAIHGAKADKHSTGGVGDKTSLVLAPIIAALGIPMAKMSGRGLGHTGGTIDKLECFPGFTTELSKEQFTENVNRIRIAIAGQSKNLAPADKKLYALRDVTATVDQMSLIAASIMSKKLAAGSDIIVLDVKTGSGAFMKRLDDAKKLAETMVQIGAMAGKQIAAVITDMDQPLGCAVGNSLEVIEAIQALSGSGPKDLMEVVLALGSKILMLAGAAESASDAEQQIISCISDGSAKKKFAEFVEAQGGDASYVWDTERFPKAKSELAVPAPAEGYITAIHAESIGLSCMMLGGGRETKESVIDPSVGICLTKKIGSFVTKGETIAVVHANDREKGAAAVRQVQNAYTVSQNAPERSELIKEIVDMVPMNNTNPVFI